MRAADSLLRRVEPLIYGGRGMPAALVLLLATLVLIAQALQIRPEARYENQLPLGHPVIQVFQQYQAPFGGANTLLIALLQKPGRGDIYQERFLAQLRATTDEVFFMPGIDRAHVYSLFTRNVRYTEVVDGGYIAGDVIPATYAPDAEMLALIRRNVGKAGIGGRLVSNDERGAMVSAEVLARDPVSGEPVSMGLLAERLENQVRGRFASPQRYRLRLLEDFPPYRAGEIAGDLYQAPSAGFHLWGSYPAVRDLESGERIERRIPGRLLAVEVQDNPDYNPDVSVHIIGYAKVVGDVTDAALQVSLFFALTVLATLLALWAYLGSLRLALLPLGCSLVAVAWEFGLLHSLGYGLDPFAIMVPFLVLAVSTSHGVQYVNTWADEVTQGRAAFEASRATFRRLFIPGSIALITNVAGFLTLYLVPVGSVRDMSVNACLGMLAVIVTNKVMMPVWLAHVGTSVVDACRRQRLARRHLGAGLWRLLARAAEPRPAALLVLLSLTVLALSWSLQGHRIIGDAQAGVPELRPDSRYNQDVAAITENFSIGTDVLKVIAETQPESCAQHESLQQIDDYAWRMQNVEGVQTVRSIADIVRQAFSGLWELNPKFNVIPQSNNILVLINQGIQTSTGLLNFHCDAMPVVLFLQDHRAETLSRVFAAAAHYDALNAREFYQRHPQADPQRCEQQAMLRRQLGQQTIDLRQRQDELLTRHYDPQQFENDPELRAVQAAYESTRAQLAHDPPLCPARFVLGSGNAGVMGATNEVVARSELPTVLGVYAMIVLLMLVCYRSLSGLLAIVIPLFMVSIFANALMGFLGIGLKVATLPVVALAVGVGVDYGIYVYDVLRHELRSGLPLREAYERTLQQTGKAVLFTGLCLSGGVAAWLFSDLQFQRDMGKLLVFMFAANMLGALLLLPAWYRLLTRTPR